MSLENEEVKYIGCMDMGLLFLLQWSRLFNLGAVAVGATIYYGSDESTRQIQEITEVFHHAHELGMVTVLWAYLRNNAFKTKEADYHTSADLTGQAII